MHGTAVWSIDEVVAGHCWRVADVNSWTVDPAGVGVSATACGFIRIVAATILVVRGQARFS